MHAGRETGIFTRLLAGGEDELRLKTRDVALIVLFGASMLLVNLGGARVLTYHEITFAQPAKEILTDGNWIVPTVAGVPFTDKPPATAWAIAASMALLGTDSEWVARLPSVLAALVTALVVAMLAARWMGRRVGIVAGLLQLTTYWTLMQARLAESDILLCAAVSVAMGAFAVANVDGPAGRVTARWPAWLFFAATGCAFLTKALVGPVFIFSSCAAFLLFSQDLRGLRFFLNPIGILIFALAAVPWCAAAYSIYPPIVDNMLLHHFGRFQGDMGQHEPIYAYLYLVPMMVLPWTPFLALGVYLGWRDGHLSAPIWRFLACWVLPGMCLLSVSAFKAKHYTIPLLPPLSIMAAAGLLAHLAGRYRSRRPWHGFLAALTIAGCVTGAVIVQATQPKGAAGIVVLIGVLCVGLLLMTYFESRRRLNRELAAMFGTAWAVAAGVQLLVMPHHDSYRPQTELARRVNTVVPADATLYMIALPDNQITFYLNSKLRRIDDPAQFSAEISAANSGSLYLLAPRMVADALGPLGQFDVLDQASRLNRYMGEQDRVTLFKLTRTTSVTERSRNPESSAARR